MKAGSNCHNYFKDGKTETTKEEFTKMWVTLINQAELAKALVTYILN